jgi:hypothetical protein
VGRRTFRRNRKKKEEEGQDARRSDWTEYVYDGLLRQFFD